VPVVDVRRFEAELIEYVRTTHSGLLADIKSSGIPDGLDAAIGAFKETFTMTGDGYHVDPTALDNVEVGDAKSTKTLATE